MHFQEPFKNKTKTTICDIIFPTVDIELEFEGE